MVNDKELLILKLLKDEFEEVSFSDILKKTPYSREPTFRHLKSLHKQNLIKKRRIANIFLYELNLDEDKLIPLLSLIDTMNLTKADKNIFKNLENTSSLFAIRIGKIILVIGDKKLQLNNMKLLSLEEFNNNIKEDREYLREILKKGKVIFNPERFYIEIRKFSKW